VAHTITALFIGFILGGNIGAILHALFRRQYDECPMCPYPGGIIPNGAKLEEKE
jgi:hypothetical protein